MLHILMGVTGCGKSTVSNLVTRATQIPFLPSYTTRAKREIDCLESHSHIFVDTMPSYCISAQHVGTEYGYDERKLSCATDYLVTSRITPLIEELQKQIPTRLYLLDTPLQLVFERLQQRQTPKEFKQLYEQREELVRLNPDVVVSEHVSVAAAIRLLEYFPQSSLTATKSRI